MFINMDLVINLNVLVVFTSIISEWKFTHIYFYIVLEALSGEFCLGCSCDFLYAHNIVILTSSMDELLKMDLWEEYQEAKRLRENVEKTKIIISGKYLLT